MLFFFFGQSLIMHSCCYIQLYHMTLLWHSPVKYRKQKVHSGNSNVAAAGTKKDWLFFFEGVNFSFLWPYDFV